MNLTVYEVLRDVREWLTDKKHWIQHGRWSRGKGDGPQTCLLGAIDRVLWQRKLAPATHMQRSVTDGSIAVAALAKQIRKVWYGVSRSANTVAGYNDSHTHADVLNVLDRAIQAEQKLMDREAKKLVKTAAREEEVTV